ncbi:MAG: hypothetical protein QE279_11395 [Rhodoferax sp.]|nr:hypothetical protein [Rhodoferax sp.]
MNKMFKSLAALVAAFTLATPAFAVEYKTLSDGAKVYDCRPTVNNISYKTEVLKEYSDQALRGLAAAGLKPTSRKYWTVTTVDKCEDLMVKPAPQKKEVKVLGGKPVVLNPQKTYNKAEYCNNGEVYMYRVTLGTIRDMPVSGTCSLDNNLTVTMAPNV